MVSVEELAGRVTRVLALIASARAKLGQACELVNEATKAWAAATHGTVDPEIAQLPAQGDAENAALAQSAETLHQAEQTLRTYLNTLGASRAAPDRPAPVAQSPPTESKPDTRVEQARQRVGRATTAGGEARGEWVRSDGWSVRITSGAGDQHHDAVVEFARTSKLPPAVIRLARHVEVKVAVAMREQRLCEATVVIDRQVCGTRPFDQAQPYTCDRYLSQFLPPGSRLRVVQADGTVVTYTGKEQESE